MVIKCSRSRRNRKLWVMNDISRKRSATFLHSSASAPSLYSLRHFNCRALSVNDQHLTFNCLSCWVVSSTIYHIDCHLYIRMLPNTGHYKYNARQQWQCSMLIHTLYNNKEGEREKKDWLIDHASIDHIDDQSISLSIDSLHTLFVLWELRRSFRALFYICLRPM